MEDGQNTLRRRGYSHPFCGCASLGFKAYQLWVPATLSVRAFTYMASGDGCARMRSLGLSQCPNKRLPVRWVARGHFSKKERRRRDEISNLPSFRARIAVSNETRLLSKFLSAIATELAQNFQQERDTPVFAVKCGLTSMHPNLRPAPGGLASLSIYSKCWRIHLTT